MFNSSLFLNGGLLHLIELKGGDFKFYPLDVFVGYLYIYYNSKYSVLCLTVLLLYHIAVVWNLGFAVQI